MAQFAPLVFQVELTPAAAVYAIATGRRCQARDRCLVEPTADEGEPVRPFDAAWQLTAPGNARMETIARLPASLTRK